MVGKIKDKKKTRAKETVQVSKVSQNLHAQIDAISPHEI